MSFVCVHLVMDVLDDIWKGILLKCLHLFLVILSLLTAKSCIFYLQDITKPISDEMCELLKRKRDSFSGLRLKQEILLCKYSMVYLSVKSY